MCHVLLLIALVSTAYADDDKKIAEDHLAEQIKATNAACGTTITASYYWKAETVKPKENPGQGALVSRCREGNRRLLW